jgi:hypothetical protein
LRLSGLERHELPFRLCPIILGRNGLTVAPERAANNPHYLLPRLPASRAAGYPGRQRVQFAQHNYCARRQLGLAGSLVYRYRGRQLIANRPFVSWPSVATDFPACGASSRTTVRKVTRDGPPPGLTFCASRLCGEPWPVVGDLMALVGGQRLNRPGFDALSSFSASASLFLGANGDRITRGTPQYRVLRELTNASVNGERPSGA